VPRRDQHQRRCATGLARGAAQCQSNLFTTIGTISSVITQSTINALPGGDNTPVERILL
jgi:hypothetical protein